ncbi:hypothetical protein NADFUDRAFT_65701 [Nadsonia fulvescens var. elongata DSM 6958]|uniref:Anaphase-promoting complex subunit 4 n=1 Tax=Nadsonia fulvescens var. elongata DSM 6958 TaxID=857566 RepID=A0A1E3PKY0_9ASCO|nr:hypothetical protein NADFUDRAFT_65701 [Nadsonia fulvescens var. elongata DSM 6958]
MAFLTLDEKTLPIPINPSLISWCPTIDLLAVGESDGGLSMYRLGGQRVLHLSGAKQQIHAIAWRPDGKMFALTFTDGQCRLYDTNTGRPLHNLRAVPGPRTNNEKASLGTQQASLLTWISTSEFLGNRNLRLFDIFLDIDILASLPRLSSLPTSISTTTATSASASSSVFTARNAIEDMIQTGINHGSNGDNYHRLDLLLTGSPNGDLALDIFGLFSVGTVSLAPGTISGLAPTRPVQHSSTGDLLKHVFIMQGGYGSSNSTLCFSSMEFGFIDKFGSYLHEVSTTSSKILALLAYIKEATAILIKETHSIQALIKTMLSPLEANLGDDTLVSELYDALITGTPDAAVQQWLYETLASGNCRAFKKWKKTSCQNYEMGRKVLFENLVPACDRVVVLLSRLNGLGQWKHRGKQLGLIPALMDHGIEAAAQSLKLCKKIIWEINDEYCHFNSFIAWLQVLIYENDSEKNAAIATDGLEDTKTMEVATYITVYLETDVLKLSVASLQTTTEELWKCCLEAFESPKAAMRSKIKLGDRITLADNYRETSICRLRIVESHSASYAYIILAEAAESTLPSSETSQLVVSRVNLGDRLAPIGISRVSYDNKWRLLAIEFIDDKEIIAMFEEGPSQTVLKAFSYASLSYSPITRTAGVLSPLVQYIEKLDLPSSVLVATRQRQFCHTEHFVPRGLAINGEKGRRIGCLLADHHQRYLVFDLDEEEGGSEEDTDLDANH